jgi:hypothetical protein
MSHFDLVLFNFTSPMLDGDIKAIAIKDGKIGGLLKQIPDGEQLLNCEGNTILPGIDDSHLHAYNYGRTFHILDVRTATCPNLEAVQKQVREAAIDSSGWIRGVGWDDTNLVGSGNQGSLTAHDLDGARSDVPVVLSDVTGHQAWCNSIALALAGLDHPGVENPSGGHFDRDNSGKPSGVVYESAVGVVNRAVPDISRAERLVAIKSGQAALLSQGIVAITDPGLGPGATTLEDGTGTYDAIGAYRELEANGELIIRANLMLLYGGLGGTTAQGVADGLDAFGPPQPMKKFGRVGVSQLKVFADGIPRSRTAWMSEPYDDCSHGHLTVAGLTDQERVEELQGIIRAGVSRGWQMGFHTTGDQAVHEVVSAIAKSDEKSKSLRHYIIHGDFADVEDFKTMSQIGMTINSNPSIRWFVGDSVVPKLGAERNARRQAIRTAWDLGVNVCASSDAPVASPDWRVIIAAMMTRSIATDSTRTDDQKLTLDQALAAMTRNAAWQSHAESWRGQIAEGFAADLIVMSGNPDWREPWSLMEHFVEQTIVGGKVVYQRGESL